MLERFLRGIIFSHSHHPLADVSAGVIPRAIVHLQAARQRRVKAISEYSL
jgi:hypothetical protein